jgi:mono/diheme cytochrome c family protein
VRDVRPFLKGVLVTAGVFVLVGVVGLVAFMSTGLTARPEPGPVETFFALGIRNFTISHHAKRFQNPIERSPEIIAAGRAHWADHCASCHANDGSGDTAMGRGLYPKPPDMRLARTQDLTDGELFYIIENGVRFTGMPGWGTGEASGESASWHLVHFIRHLPEISEPELEEMASLNPAPPAEIRQRLEEERFLRGEDQPVQQPTPAPATPHKH